MGTSHGMIESIAEDAARSINKSFADRMAKKLRARAEIRKKRWDPEVTQALGDMADIFQSEGWSP